MSVATNLLAALRGIDRTASFCCAGSMTEAAPGLVIEGFGPVPLPLEPSRLKILREYFRQAPYGQGTKTLVDTSVRQVRVLDPDGFELTGKGWNATLAGIIEKVQADLGLEKVEAHLYNLLLYEKGSFFLPHRDGERLDRMVATLVITLPCTFEGGELIIRHEGKTQTLPFGAGSDPDGTIHYGAFYADCEHEVKPLTSGQRLCLVYNLTLGKKAKAVTVPSSSGLVETLARQLTAWAALDEPKRLALALSHQYSQDGLRWDALKGTDRPQAEALAEAARQAGFVVHLALVTLWESGEGDEEEEDYRSSRKRRKVTGQPGRAAGEHEMMEVHDTSLTLDHWCDPQGQQPELGEMAIAPDDVVPPDAVTEFTPQEDFQGYTGNEGCPLERWYRRAVLVIWPRAQHFANLADSGPLDAIGSLRDMLKQCTKKKGPEREQLLADCRTYASGIFLAWSRREKKHGDNLHDLGLTAILKQLDDPKLIESYLVNVVVADDAIPVEPELTKLLDRHGWATFRTGLVAVFAATKTSSISRNSMLLELLTMAKTKDKSHNEICAELVVPFLNAIETSSQRRSVELRAPIPTEFMSAVGKSLIALGRDDLFARFHSLLKALPLIFQPSLQVRVLQSLRQDGVGLTPLLARWIESCRELLRASTATPPTPPADLRRKANFICNCATCAAVRKFLESPTESEHRIAQPEVTRRHVGYTLNGVPCDVTTSVITTKSPYVLVLKKNQASHEAALTLYNADLALLAALEELLAVPEPPAKKPTRKKKPKPGESA